MLWVWENKQEPFRYNVGLASFLFLCFIIMKLHFHNRPTISSLSLFGFFFVVFSNKIWYFSILTSNFCLLKIFFTSFQNDRMFCKVFIMKNHCHFIWDIVDGYRRTAHSNLQWTFFYLFFFFHSTSFSWRQNQHNCSGCFSLYFSNPLNFGMNLIDSFTPKLSTRIPRN